MPLFTRLLGPLGVASLLSGCVVAPPPDAYVPPPRVVVAAPVPSMLAAPGAGKDRASFDQDDGTCRAAAGTQPGGDNIYAQCMISHGDVIQATPLRYGPPAPDGYRYRYP
jgi:hypothetical protein